jgi:DNA-binding transcriptional ArsR family regulator
MTNLVDLVSSRVKAQVLRLLFGLRQPELHLRELVRQSGLSLGTVQQELRRLTRVGLVLSRRDGNRVYFRANPDHPVHRELCSLVLKTDGLVGVLGAALDVPDVEVAFVFGSVARGEAGAASDVDLMVIGRVGLRRVAKLLSGASGRIGREINPHVMTAAEFQERRRMRDRFLSTVLNSPRLLVKGTDRELEGVGGQRLAASARERTGGG